jgi:hypothetical protein
MDQRILEGDVGTVEALSILARPGAPTSDRLYSVNSGEPSREQRPQGRPFIPAILVPGSDSRHACHLGARIHDLRAALRDYRDLVLHDTEDDATF